MTSKNYVFALISFEILIDNKISKISVVPFKTT
jgi:NADH:ubiquinone oxidoreductase subunit K